MPTTQLEVGYRPVRLGLFVRSRSVNDFLDSIRLASCLWGGRFDIIVPSNVMNERAAEATRKYHLDALHPVAEGARGLTTALATDLHLRWPIFGDEITRDSDGRAYLAFADLAAALSLAPLDRHGRQAVLPTWEAGDRYAAVFAATFGDLRDSDAFGLRTAYLERTGAIEVPAAAVAQTVDRVFVPLDATAAGLQWPPPRSLHDIDGVFLGSVASLIDLRAYWNLRASGTEVLFWDKTDPSGGPFRDAVADRLRRAADALRDVPPNFRYVKCYAVSKTRKVRVPDALAKLLVGGVMPVLSPIRDEIGQIDWWDHGILIPPRLEPEQVLAHVEPWGSERSKVVVPLPRTPLARRSALERQAVVVEIGTYGDSGYEGTLRVPALPDLNDWYRWEVGGAVHAMRVAEDRLGFVDDLLSTTTELHPIPHRRILERLFERADIQASRSLPGEAAWQLMLQLGGIDAASILRVPGVRKLLSSNPARTGIGRGHARDIIRDRGSIEHADAVYGMGGRRFEASDLWSYLLHRRIFLPGLDVPCPRCQHSSFIAMRDTDDEVVCPKCSHRFALAPALQGDPLKFRLSGLLEDRPSGTGSDMEGQPAAIPVLLTLLYLSQWGARPDMTILETSTGFTGDGLEPCEADVVAITYGERPEPHVQVVIGECKGKGLVEEEDIRKLSQVARRLNDSGTQCYLLFSTTRPDFTTGEYELFHAYHDASSSHEILREAPIFISSPHLSFNRFAGDHTTGPTNSFGPGFSPLVEWSTKRLRGAGTQADAPA